MGSTLLKEPSPSDWKSAVAAAAKGDFEPLGEICRTLDVPIELVNVFSVALTDAAELTETIKADGAAELEQMEAELKMLQRVTCPSVADAAKLSARQLELQKSHSSANNRAVKASYARTWLDALHRYFPELFNRTDAARPVNSSAQLPHPTGAAITQLGLDQYSHTWRDLQRRTAPKERRKIRAVGQPPNGI